VVQAEAKLKLSMLNGACPLMIDEGVNEALGQCLL